MNDAEPQRSDEVHYDAGRGRTARVAVERSADGIRRFAFAADELKRTIVEQPGARSIETGSPVLDGLFALALEEVRENSIASINDVAFRHGGPLAIEAFETGELWHYVWTRDLSYAADLALASLDAPRCVRSLMYKTSGWKATVANGDASEQILQDTGSGGSYPVSTDRVVWALAGSRVAHFMSDADQAAWIARTLPVLRSTIEQDRALIFDPTTGLYRGEQSFLDWREQTYPPRTRDNVLEIAMSQSLSTNVTHFVILKTATDWSRHVGDQASIERYDAWAEALRIAINAQLWDEEAGLYAGYLLCDLESPIRVRRYDLLGQSLAILCGVADRERAHRVLNSYPTGPHGPSVVWPQESTVPIYHNHAIWPFVTAYWAKAAQHVGHESAVSAAIASLVRGAMLNQSNMENLDWASGEIHGESHGLAGPTINSRRQLWSVAGFVSIVQDVLFGMETTDGSIRFAPCVPSDVRRAFFGDAKSIRLRDVDYRGKRIDVTIALPPGDARLRVGDVRLNGQSIDANFVTWASLAAANDWQIEMVVDESPTTNDVKRFDRFNDARAMFGPPTPAWRSSVGQGGLDRVDGKIRLHFEPVGDRDVLFNIYRDGRPIARHVAETEWTDSDCADCDRRAHEYRVEAVFPESGHHSYPTEGRTFDPAQGTEHPHRHAGVPCRGEDVLLHVDVPRAGRYAVRLWYANPNGTINTGITCAIRRVTIAGEAGSPELASGYVIFPQTGGPQIFQRSSPLVATFAVAGRFAVRVGHDDRCRNMSYFAHNEHYTGHAGGGPMPHNEIALESARLSWLSAAES